MGSLDELGNQVTSLFDKDAQVGQAKAGTERINEEAPALRKAAAHIVAQASQVIRGRGTPRLATTNNATAASSVSDVDVAGVDGPAR